MSKILPIFIPFLGCNNRCIFCNQEAITSVNVQNDYKSDILKQYNIQTTYSNTFDQIAFYGGNFGALAEDVRSYLYHFAKEKGFKNIRYSTRVDTITDELINEALQHNVKLIELGVQSLDDTVLKLNERPYSADDTLKAIDKVSEKLDCGIQMMIGLYGEKSYSIIDESIILKDKKIKTVRLYPTLVLKNSKLERLYNEGEYHILPIAELTALSAISVIIFIANDIDVIRLSLPADVDCDENIVAGSYHKSYGDIVRTIIILIYLDIGFNITGSKDFIYYFSGYKGIARRLYSDRFIVDSSAERLQFKDIVKSVYNWGAKFEDSFRKLKITADRVAKSIEY